MNEETLVLGEQHFQEPENLKVGLPIGGWLILLGIGTTLNPFTLGFIIYTNHIKLFMSGYLSSADSYIRNLVYFEFGMNVLIFILSLVVLIGYYGKKTWFKKAWFAFVSLMLVTHCIDYVALKQSLIGDPSMFGMIRTEIIKSIGLLAVWGTYLIKSERVKNTFVR